MLFILHNTEDGLHCEMVERDKFDRWIADHTDDIQPQYHPRFVETIPTGMSEEWEYFVIDGRIVKPTPRTVVTSYDLD